MRVILWAIPRSVSTAFEKAFIQNESISVMHEPFSIPFYFGKDKRSDRYGDGNGNGDGDKSFADVYRAIMNHEGDLFVKDMAYYVDEFITTKEGFDLIKNCEHAFLFRHPQDSIYSLYKASKCDPETGWDTFDETEIGYSSLKKVYDLCCAQGKQVMLIESSHFLENPEQTLIDFCKMYNLRYTFKMLTLEKHLPEWKVWEPWHKVAIANTQFLKSKSKGCDPDILDKIRPYVEENLPIYEYFCAKLI